MMPETSNVPTLSPEKLAEYTAVRDAYHKKRDEMKTQIKGHLAQVSAHNLAIQKLEKEMEKARPKVGDATELCEPCDIYSMVYKGMEPGQGGRKHWYQCVICRHTDFTT